jgi:hypothetical protein
LYVEYTYLPIPESINFLPVDFTFKSPISGSYKSFDKYLFHRVSLEIVHFAQICFFVPALAKAHDQVQYIFQPQAEAAIVSIS